MIFHHDGVSIRQWFHWQLLIGILLLSWVSFIQAAPIPLTGVSQLWKGVQSHHSCVSTGWGEVKCWGSNNSGQLGDGTTIDRWIPVTSSISDVTAIATGESHTCVLTSSSEVKCWGSNNFGQLGDNTTTERYIPVDVTGLTAVTVTAIATGAEHACALTDSGGVKCWGNNDMGQLGDGTTTERHAPVDVAGLTSVTAIATGGFKTCALTSSGGVKCWGQGYSLTPVDVIGLTGVVDIAASVSHICVLTSSGGVKCWGDNSFGELGVDNSTVYYSTPVDVTGLTSGVTAIAVGNSSTCALMTSSGGVKCWGHNSSGQLGDGTTTDRYTPMDVIGLTNGVTAIAAGYIYACALMTSDGGVKCWGLGNSGELGNNSDIEHWTPVDVLEFIDTPPTAYSSSFSLNPTGDYPNWVVGEILVAGDYSYGDDDGDAESGTLFQWYQATNASCSTGKTAITGATAQTYTLASSDMGKYVCFGVIPKNAYGTGTEVLTTSDITIKDNQTIIFTPPVSGTYGGSATLSATGGASGNPVTFASTTTSICTVSSTTVSYISAGTCTITANQAGNAIYNAALQVTGDITVSKVNQTISFTSPVNGTSQDGGNYEVMIATATSGLTVTFASTTPSICMVDWDVVRYVDAGTCTLTASQAGDTNYNAAQETINITVKIHQIVGIDSLPVSGIIPGGTMTLNLIARSDSGLTVTLASTTTGICTVSGTTVNYISAGICILTVNQVGNANYYAAQATFRIHIPDPTVMFDYTVTNLAGSTKGYADGTGTAAKFNYPSGVAADTAGNLYVADANNHRIRKVVLATGVVTTLAGDGTAGYADSTGPAAKFSSPTDVAVDTAGNLYVADANNNRIRKVVLATGVVTTLAGDGTAGYANGTGTAAKFNYPSGVATDTAGNLYVADANNHRIRKIVIATGVIMTLVGSEQGDGSDPAQFSSSTDVAVDAAGNLYAADNWSRHCIRKIVIATGAVTTLVGYEDDYVGWHLWSQGVTADTVGNLYVANQDMARNNSHSIHKIVIATGAVTTLAGGDNVTGDYVDGIGTVARFVWPNDVVVDTVGNLYVADSDRIRKLTPPVPTAFSTTAETASAEQSFSVSGNSLTADLTVTAPTGYEVSLNAESGYATSVNLTPVAGNVASTLVYIRLSATTGGGIYNGNITLDSAGATQQTLAVTGIVTGPGYSSMPTPASTINVGTVTVGSSMSKTLSISETGTAQLDITNLALSGTDMAEFSVSPTAFSIADGGAAQTVTLTCTPTTADVKTATLTVKHNAVGSPAIYTLTCTGTTSLNENPPESNSAGLPPLPPTMNLKVGFLGNGTGSLKLQTGKNFPGTDSTLGNCKKDDECYFPNLETASWVKITPQADVGSEFKGWGGSSSCNDGNPFMMNNISCTAYFSLLPVVQPPVIIVPPVVTPPTTDPVLPPIPPVVVDPVVTPPVVPTTLPTTDVPPAIDPNLTGVTSPLTPDSVSLPNQVVTPVETPTPPAVEDSSTAGETEAISTSATESLVEPAEAETLPPVDTSPCPTDRHYRIHLDEGCDAEGQTVENLMIVWGGSLADANITGIITSDQGLVSNSTFEATAILEGGYVTDQIINHGLMKNFIFVGAQISGGILAGKIVIASQVDNEIRDVVLAAGTVIQGKIGEEFVTAKLAGKITGDATDPALLENVTIADNTELENAILSEGVVLGQNVKQKNVVMVCTNQRANGKGFDQGGFPFDDDQTCFAVQENAMTLTLDSASNWLVQPAEQLFVVIQGQKAFMFSDQWQEWNGELATLQPAQSLTVNTVQTIEFPEMSNFEGEFKFYVGLRLKNEETIVYHQVR